jgi:cytoskeletal protein CcmA (bactofilin family)
MFGKNKSIDLNTTDTIIGEGTTFEGRTKSEASIRIEGKIIGDIECLGDVTIGEKGVVKSNITARDVTIAGTLTGNINAKGKLTIMSKGNIIGNIAYEKLIIEEGGVLQGNSRQENRNSKDIKNTDQEIQNNRSLNINSYSK